MTFAGNVQGFLDGVGGNANFDSPNGLAIDAMGTIYIADSGNHRIRKLLSSGEVQTFAGGEPGYLDGNGSSARFSSPFGIAIDNQSNVFVADTYNNRIRKISPTGVVTTVAGSGVSGFKDGAGSAAQFNLPFSLDVDSLGNIYVADTGNNRIRKISPLGSVTTLAGTGGVGRVDGPATQARFTVPNDVAVDSNGNVYVADFGNHCIRRVGFGGDVVTIAGNGSPGFVDGTKMGAQLNSPTGIYFSAIGGLFVADSGNQRIRVLTPDGALTTIAGTGIAGLKNGKSSECQFSTPTDLVLNSNGEIFVSDTNNHVIRMVK